MHWFINPIKNHYADFSGRATRKEYWMFMLISLLLFGVLGMVFVFVFFAALFGGQGNNETLAIVSFGVLLITSLAIIIPSIALQVRRLHDIGKSGFWYFIGFIPYVGGIILLVMSALPSQRGTNAYGPNVYEVFASASPTPQTPPQITS
jgi:uncharacterized membrane protein YhaH (DUF805 family)